jgi:hypothetical protein
MISLHVRSVARIAVASSSKLALNAANEAFCASDHDKDVEAVQLSTDT